MYQLLKKLPNGDVYHTTVNDNRELVEHLTGTFSCTDHTVVAVINIAEKTADEMRAKKLEEIRVKLENFAENQQDLDPEIAKIINDSFWDII